MLTRTAPEPVRLIDIFTTVPYAEMRLIPTVRFANQSPPNCVGFVG